MLFKVFNCGDLRELVGQGRPPFVHVFQNALGVKNATNAFTGVIITLMFMVATSTMVATSRHLYAFGSVITLHSSVRGTDRAKPRPSSLLLCVDQQGTPDPQSPAQRHSVHDLRDGHPLWCIVQQLDGAAHHDVLLDCMYSHHLRRISRLFDSQATST